MIVTIYERNGLEFEIRCENWDYEKERYVFRDDRGRIVAVYQTDAIVGFTVKR